MDLSWDAVDVMLPPGATEAELDAFLRLPEIEALARGAGHRALNRYRTMSHLTEAEAAQEARVVIWELLRDPAARASARRYRDGLVPAVVMKTTERIRTVVDHSMDGVSTSQVRRWRGLNAQRNRMVNELGREPSRTEVVDAYNAQRWAGSADPARSSALATESDFDVRHAELVDDFGPEQMVVEDDVALFTVQARELATELVVAATAESDELGHVARVWLEAGITGAGDFATVAEICDATGLSNRQVRLRMNRLRELTRTVLAERFGILPDNA